MQKVIIKNFGPIVDVELKVQDFMVFIGPQASGKSTIAKVITFFREYKKFASQKIIEQHNSVEESEIFDTFSLASWDLMKYFDVNTYFQKNTLIQYYYSQDKWISIASAINISPLPFYTYISNELLEDLNRIESILSFYKDIKGSSIEVASFHQLAKKSQFSEEISKFFELLLGNNRWAKNDVIFIPDGRGNFSSNDTKYFDYLSLQFRDYIRNVRYSYSNLKKQPFLNNLMGTILKGEYIYENSEDFIKLLNNKKISLSIGSSGQKEAIWLLQIIKQNYFFQTIPTLFIIEEPEAHLYPEAQKDIISLIALLANSNHNQVIITTHSPYILAAINNLMYAHKVGQKHEKEVSEKIDKNTWLDYKRVGAYFVGEKEKEGEVTRIIDDEMQMIDNLYLDASVTKILNDELESILELDAKTTPI